MKLTP